MTVRDQDPFDRDEHDLAALLADAATTFTPGRDLRARVDRRAAHARRTRVAVPVGAIALLALVLVAAAATVGARRDVSIDTGSTGPAAGVPGTTPPTPVAAHAVDWTTPTVTLRADDLRIVAGRDTYVGDDPQADLKSDPGVPDRYTTLERTWHEHGIEMRLFLYFTSDGTDWWANEIRTYGNADGAWYTYTGEFFRRPLGQPFVGDLTLPAQPDGSTVHFDGLHLEAFVRPPACADRTTPLLADVLYPDIRTDTSAISGFTADLRLRDENCAVVTDLTPYRFDYSIDDPTIATVGAGCLPTSTPLPMCTSRADIRGRRVGETTLRASVHRIADGAVVATATMHVTVGPPDPTARAVPDHTTGTGA